MSDGNGGWLSANSAYCDSNTADLKAAGTENIEVRSKLIAPPKKSPNVRATLAANLVLLRHAKGWSQEALAFECGLHRTFVAHVERQARNIAIDNIERLAVALEVETFELLVPPGA